MTDDIKMPGSNKRHLIISGFIIVAAVALAVVLKMGLNLDQKQIPSVLIDKPAKTFSASWLKGREHLNLTEDPKFSLKDFKGQPVILNFWASWCFSCRQEARDFENFWQSHRETGIKVVGVAIQDTVGEANKFIKTYGKTYILGLDETGEAATNYGVTGVPETFLISADGKVIYKEAGPVSEEKLQRFAAMLLEK